MRVVLLLALFSAASIAEASAQQVELLGVVSPDLPTAASILRSRGCDTGWRHKALVDSHISITEPLRLPYGERIYLEAGLCRRRPSPEEVRLSRAIRETVRRRAPRTLTVSLSDELSQARKEVERLQLDNSGLRKQLDELKQSMASPKPPAPIIPEVREPASTSLWDWRNWFTPSSSALIVSFGLGALTAMAIASYRNRGTVYFPAVRTVKTKGEKRKFRRVSLVEEQPGTNTPLATYECLTCGERFEDRGPESLASHVRDRCARRI